MKTVEGNDPFAVLKTSDRAFAMTACSAKAILLAWERRASGLYHRRPAMYIIEPIWENFNEYKNDPDIRELLASPDVYWFVGPSCMADLETFIRAEPMIEHPTLCFSQTGLGINELVDRAYASRLEEVKRISHANEGLDFSGSLRVLLVASSFTSTMKNLCDDLAEAFKDEGIACSILSEACSSDRLGPLDLVRSIAEVSPTLLLSVNWSRCDVKDHIPKNLPFWTIVSTRESSVFKEAGPSTDRVLPQTPVLQKALAEVGWVHNDLFIPAVNPRLFHPPSTQDKETEEAVSVMSTDAVIFQDIFHPSQTNHDGMKKLFRDRILRWAIPAKRLVRAGIKTLTYGQGWTKYPRLVGTWSGVPNLSGVARAMRHAKILLHIDPDGNFNSLTMQAILSGVLPVVKHSEFDETPHWFGVYHHDKDLVGTVRRYLDNKDYRDSLIHQATGEIRQYHTYRSRALFLKELYAA